MRAILMINMSSKHAVNFIFLAYEAFIVIGIMASNLLLSYQLKLTTTRLKEGTAQWFRLANSARISFKLVYDIHG